MMRAAIDAGSNTLRLLIGTVKDGKVIPHAYHRSITRLAGGFTEDAGLSQEARERTLTALKAFVATCQDLGVVNVRAVGTAAFRQAANGHDYIRTIQAATGIKLKAISGDQEASFMAAGVLSVLDPIPKQSLIIDIGGGSTEFVLCKGQHVLWSKSIAMGVVRLTENFDSQAQRALAIETAISAIIKDVLKLCPDISELTLVGTAGTATTLAALDMQMSDYSWSKVNNYRMSLQKLQQWQARLEPLTPVQRENLPGMEAGRGDLIIPGIEVILCLMRQLRSTSICISDFGILEGLLLLPEEFDKR